MDILAVQELLPARVSEKIIDRLLSRLSHINPAIILSASKVILKFSESLGNPKIVEALCKKVSNSLISIMSRSPEIVWVFLRNIEVVLSRYPALFSNVKPFFANFTDPCFVKMQKVQVLSRLCDENSIKTIINELAEYSHDTNAEFSRFSFQVLWKVGVKYESALDQVVKSMNQILATSQEVGFTDHLLNEAAIACDVLLRRHQNEQILAETFYFVAKNSKRINKTESVCGLLNALPHFEIARREAFDIVAFYVENFLTLSPEIQTSILTATVKMFTIDANRYQENLQTLFDTIEKKVDLPDLRDHSFIYWRLLDLNFELARGIVMGRREKIDYIDSPNKEFFDELFDRTGGIAATLQERYFFKNKAAKGNAHTNNPEKKITLNRENDLLQLQTEETIDITDPKQSQATDNNILSLEIRNPSSNGQPDGPSQKDHNLELLMSEFSMAKNSIEFMASKTIKTNSRVEEYSALNLLSLDLQPKSNISVLAVEANVQSSQLKTDVFDFEYHVPKATRTIKAEFKNKESGLLLNPRSPSENGKVGIKINGRFYRETQFLYLSLFIENESGNVLNQITFELKPNLFGLVLRQTEIDQEILAGNSLKVDLPIGFDMTERLEDWKIEKNSLFDIQMSCNDEIWNFKVDCYLNNLFVS